MVITAMTVDTFLAYKISSVSDRTFLLMDGSKSLQYIVAAEFKNELNVLKIAPNNAAIKKPCNHVGNTLLTNNGYAISIGFRSSPRI